MSGESAQAESILKLAEAELAAFLEGARATLGCTCPFLTGTTWIETMLYLKWPDSNYETFFRAVTIMTAARIASQRSGPNEKRLPTIQRGPLQGENDEHERSLISV